jgi:release factor glutamine methyltransferase
MMSDSAVPSVQTHGALRKLANEVGVRVLHFIGYYALLRRTDTRLIQFAGFELTISPTVYDPRYYRAPAFFAEFIGGLALTGKTVADVGTGSGLQALAAARAGATVVAVDINPNAVATAAANACANGFEDRVVTVTSDLLSAIPPSQKFDVILSNPPFCDGRAWDIADRAWRAGPQYQDITPLFSQARERLAPDGVMYLILSSHTDLEFIGAVIRSAGFNVRIISKQRVFFETLVIFELRPIHEEPRVAMNFGAELVNC